GLQRDPAARAVQVTAVAEDREQMETGVVAEPARARRAAVEVRARCDREADNDIVGLAERDREHGVRLLALFDEPHELLRRVTDLFRGRTEMQEPAEW